MLTSPALAAAPAPARASAPAQHGAPEEANAFAKTLQRARQAKTAAARDAEAARNGPPQPAADARTTARPNGGATAPKADETAAGTVDEPAATAHDAGTPPDVASLLAGLLALPAAPPPPADGKPAGDAAAEGTLPAENGTSPPRGKAANERREQADAAVDRLLLQSQAAAGGAPPADEALVDPPLAAPSEPLPATMAPATDTRASGPPLPAFASATGMNSATAAASPAEAAPARAPFEAHLAAAIDSPAFGPALGAQVSLLVRDGVQEARLQLNPAEMGPIAVQIQLDGSQAHVAFSADFAATRAALETSLPDLAAALAANGLTLAGGGVFQQHAGRQPSPGAEGQAPIATANTAGLAGEPAAGAAPAQRVQRGLLDTYA